MDNQKPISRRNALETILTVTIVAIVASAIFLKTVTADKSYQGSKRSSEEKPFTLKIGEGDGKWVRYCGMPSDRKTFILSSYMSNAVPLYCPITEKQAYVDGMGYEVISVDQNQISLKRLPKRETDRKLKD